jgi:hypothetical protein
MLIYRVFERKVYRVHAVDLQGTCNICVWIDLQGTCNICV